MTMNGYNFTQRVRKVLAMAREEAARLHNEYVGTEHLLLGLLREGEGVATTVLERLLVDRDALALTVDAARQASASSPTRGVDLPYSSRAKKTLELAMSEARELRHAYVGTEHLLLGLIREEKGIAAQVLVAAGVTVDAARREMLSILGDATEHHEARGSADSGTAAVSDRVKGVLTDARALATRLGRAHIEPVHVAIALVQHSDGIANAALERVGCDSALLMSTLESIAPPGEPATVSGPPVLIGRLEPEGVTGGARREQRAWDAPVLETHHVLIALLDDQPSIAAAFGVQALTANRLRAEARRIVG